MGKLNVTRRSSQSPQVGDMRDRIILYNRNIVAPKFNNASFTEKYTELDKVWSSVNTKKGAPRFSGVDLDEQITTTFIIRYRSDVSSETVIEFNDDYYKILDPDNPEKRKRFLFLGCKSLGNKTLKANQ